MLCHLLITIMIYLPSPAAPPNSCIILLRISQFDHFSAFPLKSDDIQWYPMHMRHNGASKTLLLLIDGVFPISDFIHCKLLCQRQQSGRTHPRSHPRPPRCHRTSPWVRWWDRLRRASRLPLWMAAVMMNEAVVGTPCCSCFPLVFEWGKNVPASRQPFIHFSRGPLQVWYR